MTKDSKLSSAPFDLYDIFGYIVPGVIFVLTSLYVISLFYDDLPLKIQIFSLIHNIKIEDLNSIKDIPWWVETTFLISTIIIIYISGHFIASISSLLVDKFLVKKIAGYPSYRLFNLKFNEDFSIGYYKLLFFLINFYLLRLMFLNNPSKTERLLIIAFFILFIVSKLILSSEKIQNKGKMKRILNRSGIIMSKPFNFFAHFFVKAFGLHESFNDDFIKIYDKKYKEVFQIDIKKSETNLYWLSYCYVVEKNEHMRDTINHFLHLYGFTRNLSTSFFMIFIIALVIKLNGSVDTNRLNILASISYIASTIFIIRYYYLYFNYYSKFIFRSFIYLSSINK